MNQLTSQILAQQKTGRQMISLIISTIRSFRFSQSAKEAANREQDGVIAPRSGNGSAAPSSPPHATCKGTPKPWWPLWCSDSPAQLLLLHPQAFASIKHRERRAKSSSSTLVDAQPSTKPWRGPRSSLHVGAATPRGKGPVRAFYKAINGQRGCKQGGELLPPMQKASLQPQTLSQPQSGKGGGNKRAINIQSSAPKSSLCLGECNLFKLLYYCRAQRRRGLWRGHSWSNNNNKALQQ